MKKTTDSNKGHIIKPDSKQCKLYNQLEQFAQLLNRLPDAREVRGNKPRSAPQELLPMVF